MKHNIRKGMALMCVFAMVMAGCGQQGQPNKENEGTAVTESAVNTNNIVTKGSKVYADASVIELSDEVITVDGTAISEDETSAVYVANDIVFYLEGQDFTYGEGEKKDEHSQAEADAHTVVHITKPGTYAVSGTLSAGQIAIDLGKDAKKDPDAVVTLILNGVDITCSVAPGVIFYNVYECSVADEENATNTVDTSAAGANVIIADGSVNNVTGSYVARIYKPESVELTEDGTKVADAKKLHKYDAAFYSKMTMNMNGDEEGSGVLNINAANEGLDTELHLTINGGNINITSGNDGINTNEDNVSVTTVNGGTLKITVNGATGEGDGIDSNGWLVINGGTVIAEGCSFSMDAGIDSDKGIHINGGTVIATGNMLDHISESTQNYAVFQFASGQNGGETYTLKNADGHTVVSYTPGNSFTYLIFSSADMVQGTYTMWLGDAQLAGSASESMGGFGGFGGGMPGGFGGFDGEMPEGMEFPEGGFNGEFPEGGFDREIPDDFKLPEGVEGSDEIGRPVEGAEPMGRPEGGFNGQMPEGMKFPQGGFGGDMSGGMGGANRSVEFIIENGGSYFTSVSLAE